MVYDNMATTFIMLKKCGVMVMDFILQCGGEGFMSSLLQPSLIRRNRLG